jgi:hypothetical protein
MSASERRDAELVAIAGRHGCRPGLARVIVQRAREHGIPLSLGFALIEHESGFQKVFGHDPAPYAGAGLVTETKYLAYRTVRRASGNRLMQGVGEAQLTWWQTQDQADALGGCWRADANVHVAFLTLAARIHEHGEAAGIARYNGAGPAAEAYSRQVRAAASVWHERLT